MINKTLLKTTLQLIKDNPQYWDQQVWHCSTTHCFAGFVELQLMDLPIYQDIDDLLILYYKDDFSYTFDTLYPSLDTQAFLSKYPFINSFYSRFELTKHIASFALGLDSIQSELLFNCDNTLDDLHRIVDTLCNISCT